jgi:hypothetical protein
MAAGRLVFGCRLSGGCADQLRSDGGWNVAFPQPARRRARRQHIACDLLVQPHAASLAGRADPRSGTWMRQRARQRIAGSAR